MLPPSRVLSRARLGFALIIAAALLTTTGCGPQRVNSKLTYSTPTIPMNVTFSTDFQGNWSVATGFATPLGTFAIEHEFTRADDNTIVVFRNRNKGSDQAFALGRKAFLRIHTKGEHVLDVRREGNKFIIEATTLSGTVTADLMSEDEAVCRVSFQEKDPDFVVTCDRKLIVDNSVIGKDPVHVSLDSVKSVEHVRIAGFNYLLVTYKDGLYDKPVWIDVPTAQSADIKVRMVQDSVQAVSPNVATGGYTSIWWSFWYIVFFIVAGIVGLIAIFGSMSSMGGK